MKVLIVGAGGQVGSELKFSLRSELIANNVQVELVFITRRDLDLSQVDKIFDVFRRVSPDIVINAAAYTAVDAAESQHDLAFLINEVAVEQIANYCKMHKSILIHISTDYVFDGKSEKPYVESDMAAPSGVYGCSKLAGERVICALLDEYIILRTSWIFGIHGSNFVQTMLRLAKCANEVNVVDDQFGAPTSARGISEAISQIIYVLVNQGEGSSNWGTFHYSGAPYVSWADFAGEIFKQGAKIGLVESPPRVKSISTAEYPTLATRPANSRLDCSKIMNTFGIEPDDWRRSLGFMLDDIKEGSQN